MKPVALPHSRQFLLAALSACVLSLAACASPTPDEQEAAESAQARQAAAEAAAPAPDAGTGAPPIGHCDASPLQSLVGQKLSAELAEQARSDAQATSVRVLKPGQVVTMEFNGERLNLDVDAQDVITGARCG